MESKKWDMGGGTERVFDLFEKSAWPYCNFCAKPLFVTHSRCEMFMGLILDF